jgi:hypothetical protein
MRSEMADEGFENQSDDRLYVVFNMQPLQDDVATAKEGRPIFRDVEFIKIAAPGQKLEVTHRPVREKDKKRFSRRYREWQENKRQDTITGTPLAEWPGVTRSQVEELAFYNVRSVEQLASMSDGNAQNFAGIQALKAKAKTYLEKAKGDAQASALSAALSERDNQIEALRRQLKETNETLQQLAKKKQ